MPHAVHRRQFRTVPIAGMLLGFVLGLSGCATSYKVEVNSIVNPELPPGTTYVLTTADPNLPEKDLNYYEVADRVRTALAAKGMYEAPTAADADIVITIEYGAHAPKTKVTTVQSTQVMPTDPFGREIDPLTGRPYPPSITIGTGGRRSGQYPYPSYPGGGSHAVTTTEERVTQVSEKYIRLSARENIKPRDRTKKKAAQVWIVEAIIEDEDSDVHDCMQPLVDGLTDYIGVNSGGKQTVVIQADDV